MTLRGDMLLFLVLACVFGAEAAGTNLLRNPGFELGSNAININGGNIAGRIPDDWSDNSEWSPSVLQYSLRSFTATTGGLASRALCVRVVSGFAQMAQWLTLTPTSYTLSVRARVLSSSSSTVPVRIGLQQGEEPYDRYAQTVWDGAVSSGWSTLTLRGADVPKAGPVGFMVWVDAPAQVCVDDAVLLEGGGGEQLLGNPGFEGSWNSISVGDGAIRGLLPQKWFDNTDWALPNVQLRYFQGVSADARTGNSALGVEVSKGFLQLAQWVTLPAGRIYELSVWLRVASTQAGGLAATVSLRLMGEPYTTYGSATVLLTSEWTKLVVPAVALPLDNAAGGPLEMGVLLNTGGLGTLLLDDASLRAVDGLPSLALSPPAAAISRSFFAMNINNVFPGTPFWAPWGPGYEWPLVDFGIWRTWDSDIQWALLNPNRGVYNWTNMDLGASRARARGQKILVTLGQTPRWASSQPDLPSVYGLGLGSPPSSVKDFQDFLRRFHRKYRRDVIGYEVWNEPNLQGDEGFYNGSPEQLAELARAAWEVLQQEGATGTHVLLNPPMAGMAADAVMFLSRYWARCVELGVPIGGGVTWHSYNWPAELDVDSMATLRSIMAAYGISNAPVWNTEAGILQGQYDLIGRDHAVGAAYLAKMYVLNWGLGVRTVAWYAYASQILEGLTMSTEAELRPNDLNAAGLAYQRLMGWLMGARMTALARDDAGVWVAQLSRSSQAPKTSWILWSSDPRAPTLKYRVPASWLTRTKGGYLQDLLTGARTQLAFGTAQVTLTGTPVLLVRA